MVEFSYKHADKWADKVAGCKRGHNQSPIALSESRAIYDSNMAPITITGTLGQMDWVVKNNGHTVKVSLEDSDFYLNFNKDNLKKYRIISYHLHWSKKPEPGSEHSVDNKRYDVEMQIVSYNTVYEDVNQAAQHEDGLAYLAIFFKEDKVNAKQSTFRQFFNVNLSEIYQINSQCYMKPVNLGEILKKRVETDKYFRYFGSMTAPPCSEVVTWIVMSDPVKIDHNELGQLRSLILYNDDDKCYRPQQLPYQRVPLKSYNSTGCGCI